MAWDDRITPQIESFPGTVLYRPNGGMPRSVDATIDYLPAEKVENVRVVAQVVHVTVRNDVRTGIATYLTAAQGGLDLKADQIDVPMRPGGADETRKLSRIVGCDRQHLTLEIR